MKTTMSRNKSEEANKFVTGLKADGSQREECDLGKILINYKNILSELPTKDRGPFSLNVLCILCRNLEKVPSWRDRVGNQELLELSIDCLRQTRVLKNAEQVKTLACTYHIHKHVVKQNKSAQPELILKLSYMPFEVNPDNLLKEYCKTYWSILVDRFMYIEKLKANRLSIAKLLPKLIEDIMTIIRLYDPVQLCSTVLPFIVKKLHVLYSDICTKELRDIYKRIFENIATKDNMKIMGSTLEKEALDLYIKFNDCLYVIFETDARLHFKDSTVESTVRTIISLLRHRSEIFHCLQTVYLNCFCCILNNRADTGYAETVLRSFRESCETTEKLGYRKAMELTYPYIAQLMRLYMEYYINSSGEKSWKEYFDVPTQESCLGVVRFLIKRLSKAQQMSKCEGCNAKSGLHDALRLVFLVKSLVSGSISQNIDVSQLLPSFFSIVQAQYVILSELNKLGCPNHGKCLRKLQTDVHNTAIALNKAQLYEYSIKLFNMYLKTEIQSVKSDLEFKNLARALYNKGISELDCKLYKEALKSAYLSLAFSGKEGLSSVKYMSLVMDIKAKALKSSEDDENVDDRDKFQMMTILGACKLLAESSEYGNLKPFLKTLKFSELLRHEFSSYVELWPSIMPIAGVWVSFDELLNLERDSWLTVESEETLTWCLYRVMLETPIAVRNIHNDYYKAIIEKVLKRFEDQPAKKFDEVSVHATLLFLQSEYEITEASQKYGWKSSTAILDPDMAPTSRTLPLEHQVLTSAFRAVQIWTEALSQLDTAPASPHLLHCLQIAEVFVQHFLNMYSHIYGLQLAYVCCEVAKHIGAKEEYVRNAGAILFYAQEPCGMIEKLISTTIVFWKELMKSNETLETALVFACELATYYQNCGSEGTSTQLLQFAQARLMEALSTQRDINLDLAIGRLLMFARGRCGLSDANAAHRHYLAVSTSGPRWCSRALRSARVKGGVVAAGVRSCRVATALKLARRARAATAASLPVSTALAAADLHGSLTDPHCAEAQVKIDNRLKHTIGLQPTNETQPQCDIESGSKSYFVVPPYSQLEGVREARSSRRERAVSPCINTVPTFRMPVFLAHPRGCPCYACTSPYSSVLVFKACALEAAAFFRSGESSAAEAYFAGAFKALELCSSRLNEIGESRGRAEAKFQKWLLSIVERAYGEELRRTETEALIEAALYERACGDKRTADEKLVRVLELKLCPYTASEVDNCLIAFARLTNDRKSKVLGLEAEMDALRLSPPPNVQVKTPETKRVHGERAKDKRVVAEEEVPKHRRKPLRLQLEDGSGDEAKSDSTSARSDSRRFKAPVQRTPLPKLSPEYLTPCAATPRESFFTPMTSARSYSRKRVDAVKNLQQELSFSTPIANKENKVEKVEKPKTRSRSRLEVKRTLHRATSPGPLHGQRP